MNWAWAVSPTYIRHHLNEWLEMVPVNRLIAFGGDAMAVENVYSELVLAKNIISGVLSEKVSDGYYTEEESKTIARMIFHDNAARLYKLKKLCTNSHNIPRVVIKDHNKQVTSHLT